MADTLILADDAAWNWDTQPSCLYNATYNSSYIGYVDSFARVWIGRYRHDYKTWEQQALNAGSTLTQNDDHDQPAVCVLNTGNILVAWSYHNGSQYCQLSTNPGDISAWGSPVTIYDGSTNQAAYCKLFQTSDSNNTIFNFFRKANSGSSNPRPQNYTFSTNSGATWSTPVKFFEDEAVAQRPYVILHQSSGTRIDFCLTDGQPDEVNNSIYHCYMVMNSDGSDFTLYRSDDSKIDRYLIGNATGQDNGNDMPLKPSVLAKNGSTWVGRLYDGSGGTTSWNYDIVKIGSTVYVGYVTYSTASVAYDTHTYRLATLSGGTWTSQEIWDGVTHNSGGTYLPNWLVPDASSSQSRTYSGHLALDHNTANRVYLGRRYGANSTPAGTSPTGNLTANSTTVSSVSSTTGMAAGQLIMQVPNTGPRLIQPGTTIASVGAGTITLSKPAIASYTGASLWFMNSDIRIEQWDYSGGWSKTVDLTGASGNGLGNYRPIRVAGSDPTAICYLTGAFQDYTGPLTNTGTGFLSRLKSYNLAAPATTKTASPSYSSSVAPTGTTNYYLIYEGSGSTVHDLTTAANGTVVGSPTWATGTHGPELSGFSTSNYVQINSAAAAFGSASYPKWIVMLYKNSATGTGAGYGVSFASSTTNNDLLGVYLDTTAGTVGIIDRDHSNQGTTSTFACAAATDGNYHVLALLMLSATTYALYLDGFSVGSNVSKPSGSNTCDRAAIGAVLRSSAASPFAGTIGAVIIGSGSTVGMAPGLMKSMAWDLLNGQFMGTRGLSEASVVVGRRGLLYRAGSRGVQIHG